MLGELRDPDDPEHGEPDDHHRAEEAAHQTGAVALDHEQRGQHGDRDRQHEGTETGLGDLETLDRGQHRDRGRDHPVPEEQGGAEDAKRDQRPLGPGATEPGPVQERSQRQDPALAGVVGAHDESHVLDRHDHRDRPEDQRDNSIDLTGSRVHGAVVSREHGLERIQRAGADIAVDDAERGQRKGKQVVMLSRYVWRSGRN